MPSRSSLGCLALYALQPGKLRSQLLDGKAEHPHGFMERVADFAHHFLQGALLAAELVLEEFAPAPELL